MFKQREQVSGVKYYCKDCERIVDAHQVGRKYVYACNICRTKNVAFGTEKSIRSYFHVREEPVAVASPSMTSPVAPPSMTSPAQAIQAPAAPAVDEKK